MARRTRSVNRAIESAASRYGINPEWMRQIARVESSNNPHAVSPGGGYRGLFQLSPSEFRRVMGRGANINDPLDNATAAAKLFASHRAAFIRRYGEEPTLGELYMIHQQGWGGYMAHRENPDRPAWENMASTREGQERGVEWARRAISGNVPRGAQFDPSTGTSAEFLDMWTRRLSGAQPSTEAYPGEGLDLADAAAGAAAAAPVMTASLPSGKTLGEVVGAGAKAAGDFLRKSSSEPLPQVSLADLGPDQDMRAFALPQVRRRRPLG